MNRLFYLLLVAITPMSVCMEFAYAETKESPNFIVFLTDDQGWGDLGCYGHPIIQSPNLDKFAGEGLRLTQCYAACSVCSPSRSAILTGRTPYRNGVWRWIPPGSQYHLRESEITIAEILRANGYDTCHVGKWHLNGKFNSEAQPQPDDHGYDHWLATQNNASPNHLNPQNYVRNGKAVGLMKGPSAMIAVNEAIGWLESRPDQTRPFFLTVWTHEPHLPIESAEEFMKPYASIEDEGIRQHHGNITQLDAAFGKLMDSIDKLDYRDNTFVIFTSDNGPEGKGTTGRTRGSTGGLRGRKRHSHEGGIRVPGIIRWPGRITPGSTSDTPVIGSDIFSTICEIAGQQVPTDRTIDGASMLPLFEGKPINRQVPLYWRNHLASSQTRVAMRIGDWKIIGSENLDSFELYNIQNDWQETNDLKDAAPEKFLELKQRLISHDQAVLTEGPDWWKNDKPKSSKNRTRKKAQEPEQGIDSTGKFHTVLGAKVTASDFGYLVDASAGEGIALRQLATPLKSPTTIVGQYRSSQQTGNTRNAMIVIGDKPSNGGTIKLGTAIGMGAHTIFDGGWGNVGNIVKQKADFEPLETFSIKINLNPSKRSGTMMVNGKTYPFDWPAELKKIEWIGFYVKGTRSEFSEIQISSSNK